MNTQKIYYKKVRDLGGIFSASFGFIKRNFKPLYGSLLFFAGPILLLCSTITTYLFSSGNTWTRIIQEQGMTGFWSLFAQAFALAMLIQLFGRLAMTVVVNRVLIENEKLVDENLEVKHGKIGFWNDLLLLLGNTLVLLIIVAFVVWGFASIVQWLLIPGISDMNGGSAAGVIVGIVLLMLLFLVLVLIFGPIISFLLVASWFVSQRDKLFIFPAMQKVFYYMKNNFWSTWLVSIVGILTNFALGLIVQIPVFIVSFITTLTRIKSHDMNEIENASVVTIVVTVIATLLTYGVLVVYNLILTYQYTSLEEKKEGISIQEKINQVL